MRKPKIENKYKLTMKDIRNLEVDRSKLCEPTFWRNNVIDAWCVSGSTARTNADRQYCTYNSYWIGIYDKDAEAYAGKIRVNLDAHGGLCSYKIEKFYRPQDIENELDLQIQELLLEKVNELIDNGTFIRR